MKQKYTKRASPLGAVHSHDNQPSDYYISYIAHEKNIQLVLLNRKTILFDH